MRKAVTITLSEDTIKFLQSLKKSNGTPISRILEKSFEKVYGETHENPTN